MIQVEYEYIYMIPKGASPTGKTFVYECRSKKGDSMLGWIKWYGAWRQYCFYPLGGTVFNRSCLEDIRNFLTQLKLFPKLVEKKS